MKLFSSSFADNANIPARCAFGAHDPDNHVALSDNRNPQFSWSDLPEGTKSLVLICHDPDVPSKGDDVNQEGKQVPATLSRVDFYHWVLVDIPATLNSIAEGEQSSGVTARGKPGPELENGMRHGINDYTNWFAGDADMEGQYFGYDGPCPPWNDTIVHHYVFTLYALDVPRCPVDGAFTGADVLKEIEGHVIDSAKITGTYSLNPDVPA